METVYLNSAINQFKYYKFLGEQTFQQLEEEHLFWKPHSNANSIAIIVNHLWGNMMSRWTDFLHSDGEKKWRNRDLEFEEVINTKQELLGKWEDGWSCLFNALEQLDKTNWNQKVYIRNQRHHIVEAINRQLAHYAYHIGQIVYLGTLIQKNSWKSLSIPKGKSSEFNKQKFSKGKH